MSDEWINLPAMRGVPDSDVYAAVRRAGAIPKSSRLERKKAEDRIVELFRREDVSAADVVFFADYLLGKVDLKGRPADDDREIIRSQVYAIRTAEGCTLSEALTRWCERSGYTDPGVFMRLLKYITR